MPLLLIAIVAVFLLLDVDTYFMHVCVYTKNVYVIHKCEGRYTGQKKSVYKLIITLCMKECVLPTI